MGSLSFRIASGESPETMRKLCLSKKFPHQEIRWNYGIFPVEFITKNCVCEKLLSVKIDNKLDSRAHVKSFYNKVISKLRTLAKYVVSAKKNLVIYSFLTYQLNDSRMLHSRINNNKIKPLYETCFKLIYCIRKSLQKFITLKSS